MESAADQVITRLICRYYQLITSGPLYWAFIINYGPSQPVKLKANLPGSIGLHGSLRIIDRHMKRNCCTSKTNYLKSAGFTGLLAS